MICREGFAATAKKMSAITSEKQRSIEMRGRLLDLCRWIVNPDRVVVMLGRGAACRASGLIVWKRRTHGPRIQSLHNRRIGGTAFDMRNRAATGGCGRLILHIIQHAFPAWCDCSAAAGTMLCLHLVLHRGYGG